MVIFKPEEMPAQAKPPGSQLFTLRIQTKYCLRALKLGARLTFNAK
jgi:hypothetical protein